MDFEGGTTEGNSYRSKNHFTKAVVIGRWASILSKKVFQIKIKLPKFVCFLSNVTLYGTPSQYSIWTLSCLIADFPLTLKFICCGVGVCNGVVCAPLIGSMALESNNNLRPRQSHSRKRSTRTCSLLNGN